MGLQKKKKSCVFAPHETAPKDVVKEAISIHYMALWRVLLHKKWLLDTGYYTSPCVQYLHFAVHNKNHPLQRSKSQGQKARGFIDLYFVFYSKGSWVPLVAFLAGNFRLTIESWSLCSLNSLAGWIGLALNVEMLIEGYQTSLPKSQVS